VRRFLPDLIDLLAPVAAVPPGVGAP